LLIEFQYINILGKKSSSEKLINFNGKRHRWFIRKKQGLYLSMRACHFHGDRVDYISVQDGIIVENLRNLNRAADALRTNLHLDNILRFWLAKLSAEYMQIWSGFYNRRPMKEWALIIVKIAQKWNLLNWISNKETFSRGRAFCSCSKVICMPLWLSEIFDKTEKLQLTTRWNPEAIWYSLWDF